MDVLLQFGYGDDKYSFLQSKQSSITQTFGDFAASSNRLAGMDGGVYVHGYDRAPRTVGSVQAFYWLTADGSEATLTTRRQNMHKMAARGIQPLIKKIAGTSGKEVFTWAQVTNIQDAQNVRNVPFRLQQVQINFHCPLGAWLGHGSDKLVDNADSILSDGLPTVAPKVDRQSFVNATKFTVTNQGTAPAGVFIRFESPSGVLTNPQVIRRNASGQTINRVTYVDTLGTGDVIDIDCRNHLLYDNNAVVSGNYSAVAALTGEWLVIPPGTHELVMQLASSTGINLVTFDWWDTYI